VTVNEEAGFGVEPESRPTRSTNPCEGHSTAPPDRSATDPRADRDRREVARLTALPEEDWREELATTLYACDELRRIDVGEALATTRSPLPAREVLAAARRRNRAAAFRYLEAAGRRGLRSDDPKSEALLARFRRDALREAGVDERLVRGAA